MKRAMPPSPIGTGDTFRAFEASLRDRGMRAALASLLLRTDYRFIAIFRFQDGRAAAAAFFDREAPEQLTAEEVPDTATYCCFVRDGNGSFTTVDALVDPRLAAHPAREAVRAYCGVPIIDAEGQLLGTLCHYDTVPRDPSQIDLELMVLVAGLLAQGGHVPPYPTAA